VYRIKHLLKAVAHRTIFSPPKVRHCSQTIYEALLGCCRMWEATKIELWKNRAEQVLDILLEIQRPDGGFDIGYDFNFGYMHRKGESTSPELVGLIALCEYARLFDISHVQRPASLAAEWIRQHALNFKDGGIAIPYGPCTIKEVMVYNGTSFACGALGCYLGRFEGDAELDRIYQGMVHYLERVMSHAPETPGRFWYYNDQSRNDLDALKRNKIDYYHQMQQVEVHSLAQQVNPTDKQRLIISDAADHVVSLHERNPILPYTNNPSLFKGQIHLWGLSSVIPGMLEASVIVPDRRAPYFEVAKAILDWIIKHAWNETFFDPILHQNGSPVLPSRYMVRSDAWVFNALSAATKHLGQGAWTDIADQCYRKIASVHFSGPESHASTKRSRMAGFTTNTVRALVRQRL